MNLSLDRRQFLKKSALGVACTVPGLKTTGNDETSSTVLTVLGKIPVEQMGLCLAHEHVQCDFIGANETGSHRWNRQEVVQRMLPFLEDLKKAVVHSFCDCTPAYIGRDSEVLRDLAKMTDLHILTNTGFYGGANDKYIPRQAWSMSVQEMADHWIREFKEGIGSTGIRPGFIKIGVDKIADDATQLSAIDDKLVQAAARVSKETYLTVTCHTGGGKAGLTALKRFIELGANPSRFIVAHADNHGLPFNLKVADLNGWVSFDAIGRRPLNQHLKLVPAMLKHRADRLLLSQDNGWYSVGESNGGEVRGYTEIIHQFLPALSSAGVALEKAQQLLRSNPAKAFGIPV